MGIGDLIKSNILTVYKADTSDHVAGTRKLVQATEDLKKSTLDTAKAIASSWGDINGTIERGKRVWGDVSGAIEKVNELTEQFHERTKLMTAAYGVNIDRLRTASLGLRKETELLKDAALFQSGAFKLTAEQMEVAERAMVVLTRRGHESADVHKKVLDAVTALKIDGLKDLGVFVDKAGASMEDADGRTKIFEATLRELTRVAGEAGSATRTAAEEGAAAMVKQADSVDSLKNSIGGLTDALTPLTSKLAAAVGLAAQLIDEITEASSRQRREAARAGLLKSEEGQRATAGFQINARRTDLFYALGRQTGQLQGQGADELRRTVDTILQAEADQLRFNEAAGKQIAEIKGLLGAGGAAIAGVGGNLTVDRTVGRGAYDAAAASAALMAKVRASLQVDGGESVPYDFLFSGREQLNNASRLGVGSEASSSVSVFGAEITKALQDIPEARRLTNEWMDEIAARAHQKSIAEQIIGDVPSAVELAAQAFGTFKNAAGEAWGAAITGAESFGVGMKKAFGLAVLGTSKSLFATGIQEGVLALASLALGPVGGISAAAHAKASAAAFAGAAITGGIASQLGLGGGGSGGAPAGGGSGGGLSSPAPSSGGGRGSTEPTRTVYHIIGDPYDTETNSRRRLNNAKKINKRLDSSSYAVDK